ncbi:coiled-coil domain-containing protein 125 [Vanacampus margaritifer]
MLMQDVHKAISQDDDLVTGDLGYGMTVRTTSCSTRKKSQSFNGSRGPISPDADLYRRYHGRDAACIPRLMTEGWEKISTWKMRLIDASFADMSKEELRDKLLESSEVIDVLICELEVAHRYLEGKFEALKILQGKAILEQATSHTKSLLQKSEERAKALEKEVNSLQWELSFSQLQMKTSEQLWEERYNRILTENKTLTQKPTDREEEPWRLQAENSVLSRQCLELFSMLNIKEQRTLQKTNHLYSPERDASVQELADLDTCKCSCFQDPCPCTQIAAAIKNKVIQLQQQLDFQCSKRKEALMVADAFRIAFEQQLRKRSDHFMLPAESTFQKSHHCKCEGCNWHHLINVNQRLRGLLPSNMEVKISDDLLNILYKLLDLLNDKEEALAHQRKVSIMLAHKVEEMQKQLHLHCQSSDSHMSSKKPQGTADKQGLHHQTSAPTDSLVQSSLQSNI